jgi:hypothetical protein
VIVTKSLESVSATISTEGQIVVMFCEAEEQLFCFRF